MNADETMTEALERRASKRLAADALVLFGATGDLAYKKIFPALQAMMAEAFGVGGRGKFYEEAAASECADCSTRFLARPALRLGTPLDYAHWSRCACP